MNKTTRTGLLAAGLAFGMVGVGYASVPLYRLFCQVTGFAGTTQKAIGTSAPGAVAGKTMSVRFDANHAPNLPWTFAPEAKREVVTLGAQDIVFYEAQNLSDKPITGTATFNVTPSQAGKYFTKIQCFCFTEQTLQPGQKVRMPVVFYVDPAILKDPAANDIEEITLSYTFYPVDERKKQS
ncbi:MAG: cytochrome c oxidase assembly protein [Alphaproteobacteria bacterium]|jgi:cytochrome c oxidase assembly protein subunit 11|nr:cytochrome c oxidase assembly protein [Alphaproteobacteria bacterium]